MGIGAFLSEAAAADPRALAFVEGTKRLTYADWDRNSDRFAATLHRLGVRPGEVVAVLLPNGIDYPVAYLGIAKAGCVTAGINKRLGPREIEHILDRSGAAALVTSGEPRAIAERVRPEGLRLILDPSELVDKDVRPSVEVGPDDPVAIVYTSGTTGLPKGATFPLRSLVAVRDIEATLPHVHGARTIAAVPLAHMAFMTKILHFISTRTCSVLFDHWNARAALETIEREKITNTGGIPTQVQLMMLEPDFRSFDLTSIRQLTVGGAPAAPETIAKIRAAFNAPVEVRYSCTEIAIATGTHRGDSDDVVATTVGRPHPSVEVRILSPGPDGVGRIAVRSPAMMSGYWKDPESTAEAFTSDGFFDTGDLGRIGEDGNLRLAGREREMYIRGGYNIYPAEVEAVLMEHPGVELAAVIGVPDPVLGEVGLAYVVATDGVTADDLKIFVCERIADYKVPDTIEFRSGLPLAATYKVDKAALKDARKGTPSVG